MNPPTTADIIASQHATYVTDWAHWLAGQIARTET